MIICDYLQRSERIFEWVQTYLAIQNPDDLHIFEVEPSVNGFEIDYSVYDGNLWNRSSLTLFNSQILLFESFRK